MVKRISRDASDVVFRVRILAGTTCFMDKRFEKLLASGEAYWCFALVNNRLAEVHFIETKDGTRKIFGHTYVRREKYKTKREQRTMDKDIEKIRLTYRSKKYCDKSGFLK